jgi:hypothetical protein
MSGELPNRAKGYPAETWWKSEDGSEGVIIEYGEPSDWDLRYYTATETMG